MSKLIPAQLRKIQTNFENKAYNSSPQPEQYIQHLIQAALYRRKISNEMLCMNELIEIINELKIPLKNRQMHELYIYSTFQNIKQINNKRRSLSIIEQSKNTKINTKTVAEWIHMKILNKQIKIQTKPIKIQKNIPKKIQKLPAIQSSSEKLQRELKYLIQIFEGMENERNISGLIPISDKDQQSLVQINSTTIPYDPQLHELNNRLCTLRLKAEERLARILDMANNSERIKMKLEQAIQKFQRKRVEANQKTGRMGSLNACKRLIQRKKIQQSKYHNLSLNGFHDLLRASYVHQLLTMPQLKQKQII